MPDSRLEPACGGLPVRERLQGGVQTFRRRTGVEIGHTGQPGFQLPAGLFTLNERIAGAISYGNANGAQTLVTNVPQQAVQPANAGRRKPLRRPTAEAEFATLSINLTNRSTAKPRANGSYATGLVIVAIRLRNPVKTRALIGVHRWQRLYRLWGAQVEEACYSRTKSSSQRRKQSCERRTISIIGDRDESEVAQHENWVKLARWISDKTCAIDFADNGGNGAEWR